MTQSSAGRRPRIRIIIAWMLLLVGVLGSAMVIAPTAYYQAQGHEVGPNAEVEWPPGELAVIFPPRFTDASERGVSNVCTVIPEGGSPRQLEARWGEPVEPEFAGAASMTCESVGIFVTGTGARVASTTYGAGALVAFLLFVGFIGLLLLLPSLALAWGRLSIGGRLGLRMARWYRARRDRLP